MQKFNQTELAWIVKNIISNEFRDPERFYAEFGSIVRKHIKSLSKQDLTESELLKKALNSAKNFSESARLMIGVDYISSKLSAEIIRKAATEGIEINDPYFLKSAKERVKEYLQSSAQQERKRGKK